MADDDFTLRHSNFVLDEAEQAVADLFRSFFSKHSAADRVRAAEPIGWDHVLWQELLALRPVHMSLPESAGGDGGGLVQLALACEEVGRTAAPVPLVEAAVVARLLARLPDSARAQKALAAILDGEVATLSLVDAAADGRALAAGGAIASVAVSMVGTELVLVADAQPAAHEPNLACAPVGWVDFSRGEVVASGEEAAELAAAARREWQLLTASSLVGLGAASLNSGVRYAKERLAFGVSIGSFQAIAHPLADAAIAIEGARRLVMKGCWLLDHEPGIVGVLPAMAFVQASEASERCGATAMHTQGGFGFTLESDVQLFYRRAKGWSLLGGDRRRHLQQVGAHLLATAWTGDNP